MDKLLEETTAAWEREAGLPVKPPRRIRGMGIPKPRQLNGGVWEDHPGLGFTVDSDLSEPTDELRGRIDNLLSKK